MRKQLLFTLCFCLPMLVNSQFWEYHWIDQNFMFSGSGGDALTVTKTDCEEAFVQVTDPVGAPLPSFSPIIINPRDANGSDITDISAFSISFTMRARSLEQVVVGALFRSDDGTADFRTAILYDTIPAGLDNWTEITIEFTGDNISGFNTTNLRDFWFFLDRGTENFAGNEFYIDYISLGGPPTPNLESPCDLSSEIDTLLFAEYFLGDSLQNINTGSSAGQVTTFTLDTICETLQLSVTDTMNSPLGAFNAYLVNPFDEMGNEITDISDNVNVTMRVRSAEQVNVDILFRSGGGTSDERSDRKQVTIPGDLENWTTFTLEFDTSEFAGFDPADMRDMWFYLDRGEENFAGNEFYIDHIAIGGSPDTTLNSPCSLVEPEMTIFAEYFLGDSLQNINTGSSAGQVTTFTLDTICQSLQLSVTDTANAPLGAFNAYLVNPFDEMGNEITDISDNVNVTMRVRSAEQVNVDILFRSGGGTSDERSDRKQVTIPGNLENWTSFTIEFDESELGGFDPADMRDMWFYLDRGEENFAGNEFYIDHIAIGGSPDTTLNSPCSLVEPEMTIFAEYFLGDSLQNINTGSSAGQVTTFILDTICQSLQLSVTDTANAPLPAFNAYLVNPFDEMGNEITDISDNVNVTMRVRSAEQVNVDILFRSGGGTSDERSDRKQVTIPGDLENWTSFTITFDESELGGFDPANLRDMWFYLDRGEENFAGNEFYIDHITIGGAPDSTFFSPCRFGPIFAEYFQSDSIQNINTGSTAGQVTTFTLDTACETLQISVTDPVNDPLPAFNAYFVDPTDRNGNEITDITDNVNVTMRVRSAEQVNVDILFRSGGGTMEERTDRKQVTIPGGLDNWTSFTVEFSEADLAGFNPADLRDMWFYLDRGTVNFPGNEFYVDHVIIGGEADTTRNSPCLTTIEPESWIENWDTDTPVVLGGSETVNLTVTQTACEEVKIEVTDPDNIPHQAFRPIVINPLTQFGSELTNIKGNVQLVIRARSAAEVPLGVLFRSGDGSSDFRTPILTQTVTGTLEAWTTLTYTYTDDELGGFDPEDLLDFWVFLDRDNNNFPGNEVYFDYIAIGPQPDASLNSPCGLPDTIVSTKNLELLSFFNVFPNPVSQQLNIQFEKDIPVGNVNELMLFDAFGRLLFQKRIPALEQQYTLDLSSLPQGIFFLQIRNERYQYTKRILKN